MKTKICLNLIFLLSYNFTLNSQKVISFSIEQPPILEISAGENISINAFQVKRLNGEVSGGTGNYTIKWSPEDKVSDPYILDPEIINIDSSTIFTLEISDGFCIKKDQVLVDFLSVVNDFNDNFKFQLIPNPARDEFTIYSNKPVQQLTISDLSGRTIQRYYQPEGSLKYELSQYVQGLYVVGVIFFDQTFKRIMLCKL